MAEPLVLVHGDEPFLVTREGRRRQQLLWSESLSELDTEALRGPVDVDEVARSVATPPFLSPARAVVIWDPLPTGAEGRSARLQEGLLAALDQRLETTSVVLVVRAPLTAESALARAVRARGGELSAQLRPQRRAGRAEYVDRRLRERGLRLGRAARERLLELAAGDLEQLDQELEKLVLFADGRPVSDEQALLLLSAPASTAGYRLTDALFGRPSQVGTVLGELRAQADFSPPKVVGLLASQFRTLIAFAEPGQGALPPGLPDWKRKLMQEQLAQAGAARLRRWLVELADLDAEVRSGDTEEMPGLDALLARFASELSASRG